MGEMRTGATSPDYHIRVVELQHELKAERERASRMEEVLRRLIDDLDRWEDAVSRVIGMKRVYPWGHLEEARRLVGTGEEPETVVPPRGFESERYG